MEIVTNFVVGGLFGGAGGLLVSVFVNLKEDHKIEKIKRQVGAVLTAKTKKQ